MLKHPFIQSLSNQLSKPNASTFNRQLLAPVSIAKYEKAPTDTKKAAVLSILFLKESKWHIVFIERSAHEKDKHAGQISFPGGQLEADETLIQCALRETREEIGVQSDQLEIIGSLTELYVSASNFLISPFVAFAPNIMDYNPSLHEVARIIEFPVSRLLQANTLKSKNIKTPLKEFHNVPYFDLDGKVLWGATAILTHELLYNIQSLEIDFK